MLPTAALRLQPGVGEAPLFKALQMTHGELKGQRSGPLSQASNKQSGGSVSHTSSGTEQGRFGLGFVACSVIVSSSPTTFRRQQQPDKQIEWLFNARLLFLCDTLIPAVLHSLRWEQNREGWLQWLLSVSSLVSQHHQCLQLYWVSSAVKENLWTYPEHNYILLKQDQHSTIAFLDFSEQRSPRAFTFEIFTAAAEDHGSSGSGCVTHSLLYIYERWWLRVAGEAGEWQA